MNTYYLLQCLVVAVTVPDLLGLTIQPVLEIQEELHLQEDPNLYQGDMILSKDQLERLQSRKVIMSPNSYWPSDANGVIRVNYRFGDDMTDRVKVRQAIDHWESNTCIRFNEINAADGNPHLIFIDSTSCSSYVGRVNINGQNIKLHPNCLKIIGKAIHEIGHAMGFFHEQSRTGRDDYVVVLSDNIVSGYQHNFNEHNSDNFGVPYDYVSVMHYGRKFFSVSGENTLVSINPPAAQVLLGIGEYIGLSHMDRKTANLQYNCIDKWLAECGLTSDPCQNNGYLMASCDCACPFGTSGDYCENRSRNYTEAALAELSPLTETITQEGMISSPGYPTPVQQKTSYVKTIVAPQCHTVLLTIKDFEVYPRLSSGCVADGLQIRVEDPPIDAEWNCGTELSVGQQFASEGDTMIVHYFNYDYLSLSWSNQRVGYQAEIQFVQINGCEVPSEPTVTITNSGVIPPVVDQTGECSFVAKGSSTRVFQYFSPNYPNGIRTAQTCLLSLRTSEPRYLLVTLSVYRLRRRKDRLILRTMLDKKTTYTRRMRRKMIVLNTAVATIDFTQSRRRRGKTVFELTFAVINSDCHQLITLQDGASGTIEVNLYNTKPCEWWIQSPDGVGIVLDFSEYDHYETDCLVVDTNGDPKYPSSTAKEYCFSDPPGTVYSAGNQINVLFYKKSYGTRSFKVNYSTI